MQMISFFENLVFWHWWILAIGLVILEVLAPGVIFLWLGIGAALTGFVLLAASTIDWHIQLIIFACLSVISGVGGRFLIKRNPLETDQPLLNQRSARHIGRTFTLEEPIENGTGKVRIGDSNWLIKGDDMPVGTLIRVMGTEGSSLIVEEITDS